MHGALKNLQFERQPQCGSLGAWDAEESKEDVEEMLSVHGQERSEGLHLST